MTTDPTTLRTALEALVAKWDDEALRIPDRRGSIVLTSAAHELRSLLETHRTTLATPAPAADEAHAHEWHYYDGNETEGTEYRCRCGAMTDDQPAPAADEARCVHDGCPFPFDRDWHHSVLRTMGRHPFQPAPTPAPPTPSPEGAGMTGCVDPKAHRKSWRVTHRRHNHSAFNGYHWTFSAYSEVECPTCMNSVGWPRAFGSWRTRAAYVADLPGDCTR